MRLYYIANARMPSEKAHGIQIAKMCEAFIEQGVDVVLILPSRKNKVKSIKDFYGLRREVKTVMLFSFDWYDRGRVGYAVSTLSFMFSYLAYLSTHLRRGDVVYTVDLDHFAYGAIPFLNAPYFSEMHGGKPTTSLHRNLFKKAAGIIATNDITKEQLKKEFSLPEERIIVEPNGVDFTAFSPLDKQQARQKLSLPSDLKLALYVGRFFDWKGLEILPDAAKKLPSDITIGLVGGSAEEFSRVTERKSEGLVFYGEKLYAQMPDWIAAADVLLVLGTKRDEQSWQYTSPMKVFEYMACKRPIVASKTPALQNILSNDECYFYEPDDAGALAEAIVKATESDDASRAEGAYEKVRQYSWELRAKRILGFIQKRL
jgi:glycosyltransferase involved in cell wall biosynthesis